jgi:DNA-binding NtrC family response regulator
MTIPTKPEILIVDDDLAFRIGTQALLEDHGYTVTHVATGDEAKNRLSEDPCDCVLTDLVMPGISGIDLLQYIRNSHPEMPVIMVTGFASIRTAVDAMRLGAYDYVTKPCENTELLIKIERALDVGRKDRELKHLREELRDTYSFGTMISRSESMKQVFRQIQQVADADVTVLIQGESGTGKELVARALHVNSRRAAHPFVAVNCSAIPESLLESELFGHEKGAFTGAEKQRLGKFEEAHTGTLFLDEIGDTPPSVQVKLLRVLQEKTIERIGGKGPIAVEVRVVAATNRNLELLMLQGDFREDLFYRLNVFPITLPPLRERLEDIPILANHFIQQYADLGNGKVKHIAPAVMSEMEHYGWRGNIRELENLIKRAIIKSSGDTITSLELPPNKEGERPDAGASQAAADITPPYKDYLSSIVSRAEESYLVRMLHLHKGNINQAAKIMQIDRKTIYRKIAEYHLDPASFRR